MLVADKQTTCADRLSNRHTSTTLVLRDEVHECFLGFIEKAQGAGSEQEPTSALMCAKVTTEMSDLMSNPAFSRGCETEKCGPSDEIVCFPIKATLLLAPLDLSYTHPHATVRDSTLFRSTRGGCG